MAASYPEPLTLPLRFCACWEFQNKTSGNANSFLRHLHRHIPRGLSLEELPWLGL